MCVFLERDVKRDVIFGVVTSRKRTTAKASSFRERRREREREREKRERAFPSLSFFFLNTYIRARERENQTTPHGAEFEREFFHRVVVV